MFRKGLKCIQGHHFPQILTFTLGKCRKKLRDPLQVKMQDTVPETTEVNLKV